MEIRNKIKEIQGFQPENAAHAQHIIYIYKKKAIENGKLNRPLCVQQRMRYGCQSHTSKYEFDNTHIYLKKKKTNTGVNVPFNAKASANSMRSKCGKFCPQLCI